MDCNWIERCRSWLTSYESIACWRTEGRTRRSKSLMGRSAGASYKREYRSIGENCSGGMCVRSYRRWGWRLYGMQI